MPSPPGSSLAVAELNSPTDSSRKVLGVVLHDDHHMATMLLGRGVEGGPVVTVPTPTVKYVPNLAVPADGKLMSLHMPEVTDRIAESGKVVAGGAGEVDATAGSVEELPRRAAATTTVAFIRRMAVAPFDALVGWDVPPLTLGFIALACFVAFLRNTDLFFGGAPVMETYFMLGNLKNLEALLLHIAGGLAVACCTQRLNPELLPRDAPRPSTLLLHRVVVVGLVVAATTIEAIHRDWFDDSTTGGGSFASLVFSGWRRRSTAGGVMARLASVARPWLPPLEITCLYGTAVVALLATVPRTWLRQESSSGQLPKH